MDDLGKQILEERKRVVEEAFTWVGTPYQHEARIKGAGVDCAQILVAVYGTVFPDVLGNLVVEHYPHDWHLHKDDERYLSIVMQYADETDKPLPGDIVVVQFGRAYAHGGIVVEWPQVIHSYLNASACILDDFVANKEMADIGKRGGKERHKRFFSPWLKMYGRTE